MASNSSKTPPSLSKCRTYEDWLKLIKVWRCITNLPANRQGSALVLSLEDQSLDAVLEIDNEDIAKETDVDAKIESLNRLSKKDSKITKHQALEAFRRPASMSIQAFLKAFDERLYKTKSYGKVQSDDIICLNLLIYLTISKN